MSSFSPKSQIQWFQNLCKKERERTEFPTEKCVEALSKLAFLKSFSSQYLYSYGVYITLLYYVQQVSPVLLVVEWSSRVMKCIQKEWSEDTFQRSSGKNGLITLFFSLNTSTTSKWVSLCSLFMLKTRKFIFNQAEDRLKLIWIPIVTINSWFLKTKQETRIWLQ